MPAEVQVLCAQTTSARSQAYTGPDEECMCCTHIKYRLTSSLSRLSLNLRGLIFQLSHNICWPDMATARPVRFQPLTGSLEDCSENVRS